MNAPVEVKVAAGAVSSTIAGILTWILVTYVPEFHDGLPDSLGTFIPWAVSAICGAYAAWHAPHTPRSLPGEEPAAGQVTSHLSPAVPDDTVPSLEGT